MLPWEGVPGVSHLSETPGRTQDMLERLLAFGLLAGLEKPGGSLEQLSVRGEESLGILA